MTGVAKGTVLKLLVDLGRACDEYQRKTLVGLRCKRIQCDEIWSFCYAKAKNVPQEKRGQLGYGDVWTWTAIDADTKLAVSWLVGERDAGYAMEFMGDVAKRLTKRVQLTTDGLKAYLMAVEDAFGREIDYAQLVMLYGVSRRERSATVRLNALDVRNTPSRDSLIRSMSPRPMLNGRTSPCA
jgi:IS1 family transposase